MPVCIFFITLSHFHGNLARFKHSTYKTIFLHGFTKYYSIVFFLSSADFEKSVKLILVPFVSNLYLEVFWFFSLSFIFLNLSNYLGDITVVVSPICLF